MKFKLNYIVIPALVILIDSLGNIFHPSYYSMFSGMPLSVIPVWLLVFYVAAQALTMLLIWNTFSHHERHFYPIMALCTLFGISPAIFTILPTAFMNLYLFSEIFIGLIIVAILLAHHLFIAGSSAYLYLIFTFIASALFGAATSFLLSGAVWLIIAGALLSYRKRISTAPALYFLFFPIGCFCIAWVLAIIGFFRIG